MAGAWRKNEEKVKRRLYELREQAYSSGFDSKERALIWEELLLGHDDDFDLDDVSGISDEDLLDDGPLAHLRHKEQPSKQGKKQASGEGETLKSVGEDSAGEDSAGELEQLEVGKVLARQTRERIKEINVIEADVRRSCFSWDTHKRLSEKDRSSQRRTLLHMLARVLSGPKDVAGLHGNREATASDVGGNDSALNSGKMEVISLSELRKRRGSDDADETDLAQGARLSTASTGTASASGAVRASSSSGPAGAPITATTVADAWHGIKNQAEHEPKYKYFQGFHDICLLFLEACKTTHELHEKNPLFRKSAIEKRMSSRRSTTTSSSGRSGQLGAIFDAHDNAIEDDPHIGLAAELLDLFTERSLIREFLSPDKTFDKIIFPLFDVLAQILRLGDPELARHLKVKSSTNTTSLHFALPWLLTFFSHSIEELDTLLWIFDVLIVESRIAVHFSETETNTKEKEQGRPLISSGLHTDEEDDDGLEGVLPDSKGYHAILFLIAGLLINERAGVLKLGLGGESRSGGPPPDASMFAMLLSSEADLRPVSEEDATFVELHMHFSSSNFSFARVDTGRWLRTTKLLLEGKYEQIFKQEHEQDDEPIIQASLSSSTSRCRTTSTDEARAVHDVVEESRASGASDSEKSRIPSSSSKGSSTLDDLDLSMRHIMDTLRTHREEVAIREARKAQALAIRNRFPTKKRALAYTSFTGAAAFAGSLAATQQELLLVADALVAFAHPHVALLVTAWRQLLQWFLSTSVGVYIARTVLGETTSASAQPAFVVFILENFINPLVSAVAAVGRALGLFSKPEPTAFEQFLLYLLELYRYARIFVLDITEAEFLAEQVGSMNKHQRQGFALLGIGIFFVYIGILRVAYSGIKHSARKHQQLELHDKTK